MNVNKVSHHWEKKGKEKEKKDIVCELFMKAFYEHLWEGFPTHNVVGSLHRLLARLSTKSHVHHLLFQFVSEGNVLVLPSAKSPNQDFL